MTDSAAETAVAAVADEFVADSVDPEDPEAAEGEELPPRGERPLAAAADEADVVEQTREVPVDDDEYPR